MSKNDPWQWDEGKIWESILDPNFIIHPEHNAELFKWWHEKIGISKEEYVEMDAAQLALVDNDWDDLELNEFSKERIEIFSILNSYFIRKYYWDTKDLKRRAKINMFNNCSHFFWNF